MGRWSRLAAAEFLSWLDLQPGLHWLDLGCGTGALTAAILERADPSSVLACDPSESLLELARQRIRDPRVVFKVASATDFAEPSHELNVFVSGLVLNFIDGPTTAIEAIARHVSPDGVVAAYVWDYSEGMEFLRAFWDAARDLDASASDLDEGTRFPLCAPEPLRSLFEEVGLKSVEVVPLEIETRFESFSDYWDPFLGATGPAPSYVESLSPEDRRQLEETLLTRLSPRGDEGFLLTARAWAVRGSTQ